MLQGTCTDLGAAQRGSGRALRGAGCMPREQLGGSASSRGSGSVQRGLCGSGSNSEVLRRRLPEGAARPGAAQRVWVAAVGRESCADRSVNPTAQAPEHRAPGHSPGSGLPRDRQRPGGPRTARTLLPQLSRSAAPPGASRPCRRRAPELLRGLTPGLQSWPRHCGCSSWGLTG